MDLLHTKDRMATTIGAASLRNTCLKRVPEQLNAEQDPQQFISKLPWIVQKEIWDIVSGKGAKLRELEDTIQQKMPLADREKLYKFDHNQASTGADAVALQEHMRLDDNKQVDETSWDYQNQFWVALWQKVASHQNRYVAAYRDGPWVGHVGNCVQLHKNGGSTVPRFGICHQSLRYEGCCHDEHFEFNDLISSSLLNNRMQPFSGCSLMILLNEAIPRTLHRSVTQIEISFGGTTRVCLSKSTGTAALSSASFMDLPYTSPSWRSV